MRICERCKNQLVDDRAGFSADGRIVCTRTGCQFVEEINRQVKDGTLVFADVEQFTVDLKFPTAPTPMGHLKRDFNQGLRAIHLRPLPKDEKERDGESS